MKLILIYGPPAVGKFTIAKELAGLTGFKLLHNHLTVDAVSLIFEKGTAQYRRALQKIRLLMLEEAVRANVIGMIMTLVWAPGVTAVDQYAEVIERNGGEFCLVRLYCDLTTLQERVVSHERRIFGKIVNVDILNKELRQLGEPFAMIDNRESLSLNAGEMSAIQAAEEIIKKFNLSRVVP